MLSTKPKHIITIKQNKTKDHTFLDMLMCKRICLETDELQTFPFTNEKMYALFRVWLLMETEAKGITYTQTF